MCALKTGNLLMELKFFFVFSDIRIEKNPRMFLVSFENIFNDQLFEGGNGIIYTWTAG